MKPRVGSEVDIKKKKKKKQAKKQTKKTNEEAGRREAEIWEPGMCEI